MRRTFEVDVLDYPPFAKATDGKPECGERLRLLATISRREVIERILTHLGLPTDPVVPEPARQSEELFA